MHMLSFWCFDIFDQYFFLSSQNLPRRANIFPDVYHGQKQKYSDWYEEDIYSTAFLDSKYRTHFSALYFLDP